MIAYFTFEGVTAFATTASVIVAVAALFVLNATMGVQARSVAIQQRASEAQLKQVEIALNAHRLQAVAHTERIKPKFNCLELAHSSQYFENKPALNEAQLAVISGTYITKSLSIKFITKDTDVWISKPEDLQQDIVLPETIFHFIARFKTGIPVNDQYPSDLDLVLRFKDDDEKEYVQKIYTYYTAAGYVVNAKPPVLIKYLGKKENG